MSGSVHTLIFSIMSKGLAQLPQCWTFFCFTGFLKTFNIMGYQITFTGTNEEEIIYVFQNQFNNIFISIESYGQEAFVEMDIPTAIKFAKTLRTEINKAKEASNE